MQQIDPRTSRSRAVYDLLLSLYPQEYLRWHRAEMLQNFEDFDANSSSKVELWLFMGKDLLLSLRPYFTPSLWGQLTVIIAVLGVVIAIASHHPGRHEHYIWLLAYGYLLGWFSGWWRKSRQIRKTSVAPDFVTSFWGQAIISWVVLATVFGIAQKIFSAHERTIWALCWGYFVAWPKGWLCKRWQLRE